MQHHETLQCGKPGRPLPSKVGGKLGEERVIDGDHTFPATLADHTQLTATLIDIGE
jgi:hypothetical protein